MIAWCGSCLTFQGESAPYADGTVSSTLCPRCVERPEAGELAEARMQSLDYLRLAILEVARRQDVGSIQPLLRQSAALGIRATDLLAGLVAPMLWDIGEQWAQGTCSVAEEHEFTTWCEALFSAVAFHDPALLQRSNHHLPQVLLACVDGNYHVLGTRLAALWLAERGWRVRACSPGLPAADIANQLRLHNPRALGLSISMPEQREATQATLDSVTRFFPGIIFLGGQAVRSGHITNWDVPHGVGLMHQLQQADLALLQAGILPEPHAQALAL